MLELINAAEKNNTLTLDLIVLRQSYWNVKDRPKLKGHRINVSGTITVQAFHPLNYLHVCYNQ